MFFLDLASHDGLLACVSAEKTLSSIAIDHRITDADLAPLIEETVIKAGWTFADLTNIACVTGPGGFTSLRVAVATANALSFSLKIPTAGIHLSDLYEAKIQRSKIKDQTIWWLHSTKKEELFVRGFGKSSDRIAAPAWMKLADALPLFQSGDLWMGELIPEQRAQIDAVGMSSAALRSIGDILPAFLSSVPSTGGLLEPWYGRGW